MFPLKKKNTERRSYPAKERLARRLAAGIVAFQFFLAARLNRWQARTSARSRNLVLLLVGLLWAAACSYILAGAFLNKGGQQLIRNPAGGASSPAGGDTTIIKGKEPIHKQSIQQH